MLFGDRVLDHALADAGLRRVNRSNTDCTLQRVLPAQMRVN